MQIAALDRQVEVTSGPERYRDAKKLSDLQDCQYLVLLGEPGLGKSVALSYLAALCGARVERAYRGDICETSSGLPIFVDGLDEASPEYAMRIAGSLSRSLQCKWRVTCRVEDWIAGGQLSDSFSRDYAAPLEEPVVALLQPLDAIEAETILRAMGHTDPGSLLERLHTVGATPFAQTPLGLKFLVDLPVDFQFKGRFDLYEQGVEQLAREANPARKHGPESPSVLEILDVAGRCFLTMLLCGRHGLRQTGTDEHSLSREDLGLRPQMFDSVLDTGLFLKDGDSFRPMHRSVLEFLAARFLAHAIRDGKVPFERALALLVAGDGLPPDQYKSVFAWFAAHLEQVGHYSSSVRLVQLDPESMATHGDPGALSEFSRAFILRSMGERDPYFRSGAWESASSGSCLAGLVKTDVLAVAEEVLRSPSLNIHRTLTTLTAIAQGHPIEDLAAACLEIVHRPQVGVVCREHAVKAWAHCCGPTSDEIWAEIARSIEDGEDEWEGRDRVVAELFCLLPPADLSADDVSRVLEALRRPAGSSIFSPVRHGFPSIYAIRDIAWHIASSQVWRPLFLANPKAWFTAHGTGSLEHRLAYAVCTAALAHEPDASLDDFILMMIATGAIVGAETSGFGTLAMKWIGAKADQVEIAKALCMALDEELAERGSLSAGFRRIGLHVTAEFTLWLLTSESLISKFGAGAVAQTAVDTARELGEPLPNWFGDLLLTLGDQGAVPAARTVAETLAEEMSARHQTSVQGSIDAFLSESIPLWSDDLAAIEAGESEDPLNWGAVLYSGRQVLSDMTRGVGGEAFVRRVFGVELGDAILAGIVALLERGEAVREEAAAAASILLSRGETTVLDGLEPQALLDIYVAAGDVCDPEIKQRIWDYVIQRLSALAECEPERLDRAVQAFVSKQSLVTALYRHSQASGFHTWFVRRQFAAPASLTGNVLSELISIAQALLPEEYLLEAAAAVLGKERFSDRQPADSPHLPGVHAHLNSMRIRDLLRWAFVGTLYAPNSFAAALSEGVKVADLPTVSQILLEGAYQEECHLAPSRRAMGCGAVLRVLMGRYTTAELSGGPYWSGVLRLLESLSSQVNTQSGEILRELADFAQGTDWAGTMRHDLERYNRRRRDLDVQMLTPANVDAVLAGRGPATAADLRALVVTVLEEIASEMQSSSLNDWRQYWEKTGKGVTSLKPKVENDCRDALALRLKDLLRRYGDFTVAPEVTSSGSTRADLVVSYGQGISVPIEIKKSDHDYLWVGHTGQLQTYTLELSCKGHGIYLVFWFGEDVKVTAPPVNTPTPNSPHELQKLLTGRLPARQKPLTTVIVLDVSNASAAAAARKKAPFLEDQVDKRADREARQKASGKPRRSGNTGKQ